MQTISSGRPAFASSTSVNQVATLSRKAQAAVAAQHWEDAVAYYEQAIELAPRSATLRVELGAVLIKLGRLPEAISIDREALRIAPHDMAAETGMAQAYRNIPNFEEAKHILQASSREHANAAEPLAAMADMEIQLQMYDAAITHLKAAIHLTAANVANRNLLAAAYKAKGDTPNALVELRKVLARDPENALALYLQSEIYADQTEDELALAGARKVVELQPTNPRARVLLGKILLRTVSGKSPSDVTKRCGDAVAALKPIMETQSKSSETLFLLSRAYRCAGQSEEADRAVAAFEAASQSDRNAKEGEVQSRHLVQEANNAALRNNRAQALDLAQQALAKNPNDGSAYSLLAKIYFSSGNIDDASVAITKALEQDPYHPEFLYVQGKILQKQGRLDEALTAFVRTTLVNPQESDAYFEIGTIYQQRNDPQHAAAAYKKALELSPGDLDYRHALASVFSAGRSKP
jgi:tetratricopeptide (TPR) repeat protein